MTPKSINIAVAEKITELGSAKVVDIVISNLVNAEIKNRADSLASAIKLSEETLRELRKVSKPDQISIDSNGTRTETYSSKAFESKKKVEEKLARIEKTVQNAIDNGEWTKLHELSKGVNQSPPDSESQSE